jgi:hypothetical protein
MSESTKAKFKADYSASAIFRPTDKMRRAKANLLTAIQTGQAVQGSLGLLSVKELARLSRQPDVLNWTRETGFLPWFTDDAEALSQIGYLRMLALEAAENVLQDPDTRSAGAKVTLIKALLSMDSGDHPKEKPMNMDDLKKLVMDNRLLLLPLLEEAKKE